VDVQPKVLIVERDQLVRQLLVRVVQRAVPHADVVETTTVTEALHFNTQTRFNIVLTADQLVDAAGTRIIQTLQQQTPAIPVVVLVSVPGAEHLAHAAGATAVFSRPFDIQGLLVTLQRILSS